MHMDEKDLQCRMGKKQFIEQIFARTLFQASDGEITGLIYNIETEVVTVYSNGNPWRQCSVACDSKMACIRDIAKAIDW